MLKFKTPPVEIGTKARKQTVGAVESIVFDLERQAIEILVKSDICSACYYSPPFPSDWDVWRQFWLNEARHQCESFDPVGEAGHHLNDAVRAAVNVLLTASALRQALDTGTAHEVAALTMVLISDTVAGSLSIDLENVHEQYAEAKRLPYEKGIGKRSEDLQKMRTRCIEFAVARWNIDPFIRTGEMAIEALDFASEKFHEYKTLTELPKNETVAQWLRSAHKQGELVIPPSARKGGKPRAIAAKPCTR